MLALTLLAAAGAAPSLRPVPTGALSAARGPRAAVRMEYIPDGLTKEQWRQIKEKERQQRDLGRTGVKGFQSRSMYAFMKAKERGEATNLFPVDPAKVRSGEIPLEKVPYMQRKGGKWDQSDVKGARKRRWTNYDKAYESSGESQAASVSIFGGANLPWTSKDLKGMSQGPDAELIRQWKRMGIKVDKNGNPIQAARQREAKGGAGSAAEKPRAGGLFGGLFGQR